MSDVKQVSAALVKAQRDFGPALKDKTNPAFRSKYADLGACVDAVMDALNANGIALIQRTLPCESGVTVETVFVHESGESLACGPLHVPASKQDPQGYGSALTYARRYSLMSACGIAPEDDDGNAGSKKHEKKVELVGMSNTKINEWCDFISKSATSGELKSRLAEALQAATEVRDSEAAAAFNAVAKKTVDAARAKKEAA